MTSTLQYICTQFKSHLRKYELCICIPCTSNAHFTCITLHVCLHINLNYMCIFTCLNILSCYWESICIQLRHSWNYVHMLYKCTNVNCRSWKCVHLWCTSDVHICMFENIDYCKNIIQFVFESKLSLAFETS